MARVIRQCMHCWREKMCDVGGGFFRGFTVWRRHRVGRRAPFLDRTLMVFRMRRIGRVRVPVNRWGGQPKHGRIAHDVDAGCFGTEMNRRPWACGGGLPAHLPIGALMEGVVLVGDGARRSRRHIEDAASSGRAADARGECRQREGGGRRLEGSTVDDLGRGLDVPPVFFRRTAAGLAARCRSPVAGAEGLGRTIATKPVDVPAVATRKPPWHDASSGAARIWAAVGNSLIGRLSCCGSCRE